MTSEFILKSIPFLILNNDTQKECCFELHSILLGLRCLYEILELFLSSFNDFLIYFNIMTAKKRKNS